MATSFSVNSISVLFDFSPESIASSHYIASNCRGLNAEFHFLVLSDTFSMKFLNCNNEEMFKSKASERLDEISKLIREKYAISTSFSFVEKNSIDFIISYLTRQPNVLPVLGLGNRKSRHEIFCESWANKLALKIENPVLVLPEHNRVLFGMSKILVLIDESHFNTREKIPYAVYLSQKRACEVYVIGLDKGSGNESRGHLRALLAQVDKYLQQRGVHFQSSIRLIRNKNQESVQIASDLDVDMMLVMAEKESSFGGLFGSSFSNYVLQHFSIPVLVIPPKVNTVTANVTI
jgi:nucleotide-binding universal stress UspA family protein